MDLGFDLESLSPVMRKLLLILPGLAIAAVGLGFFILPVFEERSKLEAELEQQVASIDKVRQSTQRLPVLIAESERLRQRLADLRLQLPEGREVSGLLRQVSELAGQSGLKVVAWKPRDRVLHPAREVFEIPVDVEMRGTYHQFGRFFSMLTGLDRVVNIGNIQLKMADQKFQKGGSNAVLGMTFNAFTYSPATDAEIKAAEAKAPKEGKEDKK